MSSSVVCLSYTGTKSPSLSGTFVKANNRPWEENGPFPQGRKTSPAAHQAASLMKERKTPKENKEPERLSWVETGSCGRTEE